MYVALCAHHVGTESSPLPLRLPGLPCASQSGPLAGQWGCVLLIIGFSIHHLPKGINV